LKESLTALQLKKTWQKSCNIFGGEIEVEKVIEYYENNSDKLTL